jgi:hypothetical protein
MRLAQVTGLTGAGIVAEIHESASVQALQDFLDAREIEGRAVEALSSWVRVGTGYDGINFVSPEVPVIPEPEPIEPTPTPVDFIKSELDGLRQQAISKYIAQWGEVSKAELWPLLDAEMIRAATDLAVVPENYPAIVGFLIASGFPAPTAELIATTTANLRANKIAHVQFLRKGELWRQQLIAEYEALTDEQKLGWSAAVRWAELEAAE